MRVLEDKNRDYQRIRQNIDEKIYLAEQGLQHTLSSNVSAVGVSGNDLVIRFHNGSLYRYFNYGNRFDDIMKSNSKGKWVWRYLRRAGVSYEKIGVISFPSDLDMTDKEMFNEIDKTYTSDLNKVLQTDIKITNTDQDVNQIDIGGLKVFKPNVLQEEQTLVGGLNRALNTDVETNVVDELIVFSLGGINVYKPIK